jgi:hypothetical protein
MHSHPTSFGYSTPGFSFLTTRGLFLNLQWQHSLQLVTDFYIAPGKM